MTDKQTLESWKEIARYLNRDVRTCQRWEKERGLPIQRREDPPGHRVFAYRLELDDWLRENRRPEGTGRKSLKILLPAGILLLGTAVAVFFLSRRPGVPADFSIQDSRLVIRDDTGREIWSYDTGRVSLLQEGWYRARFQEPALPSGPDRDPAMPHLMIRDLSGDGIPDVLFAPMFLDWEGSDTLLYFSGGNRPSWSYKVGRPLRYGGRTYPDSYRITGIGAHDLDGDGRGEILLIARHRQHFPNVAILLDVQGGVLGEYWNSGTINAFGFIDLDGDGSEEIILGGENREWKSAAGIALDSGRFQGSSPQSQDYYRADDLEQGLELCYLLVPRNSVDYIEFSTNSISKVEIIISNRMVLTTKHCGIAFELDRDMELKDIVFTPSFLEAHRRLSERGTVTRTLEEIRKEILGRGLKYFDGSGWTSSPSRGRSGR